MSSAPKFSRTLLWIVLAAIVGSAIVLLLLPKPLPVDLGQVQRIDLEVMIVEEGRTNVRETYIVSTPVAGRLQRVQMHAGDTVENGETVVARMLPTNPAVLDRRTREQATAAVEAAAAGVMLAQSNLEAALADEVLTRSELERTQALFESGIVSRAALDRAVGAERASRANRATAEAAMSMREAELGNAEAILASQYDESSGQDNVSLPEQEIPLRSPIDGRILQVFQESETVLPAGAPIMEIGNVEGDLEVIVDLISSDAVRVSVGDPVLLRDWGRDNELRGEVVRVDPYGVTKVSALGIEEQRVRVEIALTSPPEEREGLGHRYRLEVGIIVWQGKNVLAVPSSALFRTNGGWTVFKAVDGVATPQIVRTGMSDGLFTVVEDGLEPGEQVVLYPSVAVEDGVRIESR